MKKLCLFILLIAAGIVHGKIELINYNTNQLVYRVELESRIAEDRNFVSVETVGSDIDNWTNIIESGSPELLYRELLIAVPPEGDLSFSYDVKEADISKLSKPYRPAPQIISGDKSSDFIYAVDRGRYSDYNDLVVVKKEAYNHFGYRLIPIKIYPVTLKSQSSEIIIIHKMEITIDILGNTTFRGNEDRKREWLNKEFIANYQQGKYWKEDQQKPVSTIPWEKSQFWYKIKLPYSGSFDITESADNVLPNWVGDEDLRLFSVEKNNGVFESDELALACEDGKICLSYYGEYKTLWLAAGGDFSFEPLRVRDLHKDNLESLELIERERVERDDRDIKCIMIRPEGFFEDAAEELSLFHYDYFGVETAIAVQEQIFDESGGLADTAAIRDFLQMYEFEHPGLEYVVLLGSGTSNFDVQSDKNKIIAWDKVGLTSDDHFVDFDLDNYADLAIGRIPAKSESMMNEFLQRLKDYYDNMENGWWQNKILLVADDENKGGSLEGIGNTGMNHTLKMELTAEELPGRMLDKVYGIEYSFDSFQNKPGVSEDMISAINEGRLITYYIGHGSWKGLGDEAYFSNAQIPQLQNYEHLTHFVAGSCNVGNYDQLDNDSMAELLLFTDDGGAICCLAATEESTPDANYKLLKSYLDRLSNYSYSAGNALLYAKNNSGAARTNSKKYNLLGDPVMRFPIPQLMGDITLSEDSLLHRQTVDLSGDFGISRLDGEGEIIVYDSEQLIHYTNYIAPDTTLVYYVDFYRTANSIFRGAVELVSGEYTSTFIVPDNAGSGSRGRVLTLSGDADGEYINLKEGVIYSEQAVDEINTQAPSIDVYLETRSFRNGDTVSETPLLIADISDENGINLTMSSGKNMQVLFDGSNDLNDLIDVTEGFIYNQDSYTEGVLNWQLPKLEKGEHFLQLIVYDNFGLANVAEVEFDVVETGSLGITDMLPYPNPMSEEGYFTFVLTADADINIKIFTISGKKIKTISSSGTVGYNQIYWNCRDADGDEIANNTYFYKVIAKDVVNGKTAEKIGKLIILH